MKTASNRRERQAFREFIMTLPPERQDMQITALLKWLRSVANREDTAHAPVATREIGGAA